jgi:hypothetical protein
MGKLTISMAIFQLAFPMFTRGYIPMIWGKQHTYYYLLGD